MSAAGGGKPPFPTAPIARVRVGMHVVDAAGEELGRVVRVHRREETLDVQATDPDPDAPVYRVPAACVGLTTSATLVLTARKDELS